MRLGRSRRGVQGRDPAASRQGAGGGQSPFSIGDLVKHPAFGEGTIIQVESRGDDWDLTVAFKGRGIKTLALGFAKLEKLDR
jgi:DNA helicase-2/ATP-dependent DNA helicase PcrA